MKYEASFGGRLFSFMQKPLTFCSYKAAWLGGKRIVINNLYDYSVVSLETLFSYKKMYDKFCTKNESGKPDRQAGVHWKLVQRF